ncbi:MAG: AAA family ATPase [Propionicimonas sp.]|uniref:AAA family ATPase n=1 Tax=Propionicimonas sp. TaxID=1955623 RepID=UPI003D1414B4
MTTPTLSSALAALTAAASAAGLDPDAAAEEGLVLSAAVAESNRGAFVDWCREVGVPASAQAFMDAAVRGRRYRGAPTPLASQAAASATPAAGGYAQALADVCHAAAVLGEPGPSALGAASLAAAAQLPGAMAHRPITTGPAATPTGADDAAQREFVRQAPAILTDVLARLQSSQQQLLDVSRLDPAVGGAFPGLGGTPFPTPTLSPGPATTAVDGHDPAATPSATAPAQPAIAEATPAPDAKPAEPEKTVEEWLAELDALVGLATVKAEIRRQTAILRVDALRTKAGLKSPTITRHLVFVGNPGTGKTTVARLVAGIYKAIGLLSKGQLVEVDRSELVAGYLGQTAIKTAEVAGKAYGGVLFIDEAYSLNGDQYGEEAINTLVKEMEDHRDDLVVIVAGYPAPMDEFISNNPGLASRFRTTITFDDYTDDELRRIFTQMAETSDYDLGEGVIDEFTSQLSRQRRDETFGNGRFARNLLEAAIGRHAWRLREVTEPTIEQLRTLLPEDLVDDGAAPEPEPGAPLTPPASAAPIPAVEFPARPGGEGPSDVSPGDARPAEPS